ncbi:hypothetical protein EV175_000269 [Coemansia sp. RSA 1933]|nr:hypothetical protein EV175_000269 [Coemansia sp. RSA 1933]
MMANPHMRRAIEENPELRKIMSDPSIMRQSLDAAQNPQLMQEVQRNNDRALSNLESAPGGYAHIRRMYHSIQEPLNQAARDSSRTPLDDLNKRRAKILGVSKPNPDRVNTMPLPNPWAKRRRPSVGTAPASSSSSVATTRRSMASTAADQVSRSADRLALLDISSARHTTPSAAESRAAEMRDPLGIMQMHEQMGSLPSFMSAMEESGMVRRSGRGLSVDAGAPEHHHSSQEPPSQSNDRHQQGAATADMSEDELDRFQRQFQSELDQLEEMGFIDRSKNLKALIETNGDLSLAINIITGEDD